MRRSRMFPSSRIRSGVGIAGAVVEGLPGGAVAVYDFVQGANAQTLYDKSGNGNNGTLGATGGAEGTDPTWTAQGLLFDGVGDYAKGPNFQLGDFTAVAVFSSTRIDPNNAALLSLTDAFSDLKSNFVLDQSSAGYKLTVGDNAVAKQATVVDGRSNTPIMAAGSFAESTRSQRIYIDGTLRSTVQGVVSARKSPTAALYIGSYFTGKFFGGAIYYAALYPRALSDAEVAQAYRVIKRTLTARGVTLP